MPDSIPGSGQISTPQYHYDELYIGGEWTKPTGADRLVVRSPHSLEVVGSVPRATEHDLQRAVRSAREAFDCGPWPRMGADERAATLERFSRAYYRRSPELAALITGEVGSPSSFSQVAQALAPWMMLDSFLNAAREHPWEQERRGTLGNRIVVAREPVGVVGAIVPWNMPQFLAMSKLAPALLAGCTVVLKPPPEAPLDSMVMAESLSEAGLPPGVVSIVAGDGQLGEAMVRHEWVDKVAFTGSTAVGRRIGSRCGEQLKRCSLELGGKSAAIVLEDADLDRTADGLRFASLMNNGQACVAHSRILAPKRRYEEVVDAVASMMDSLVVGDPSDPETAIGPLATAAQQERVGRYIEAGIGEGARVVVGGPGMPAGVDRGWYVRPTLFADATNDMVVSREEIFGPVLVVIPYADEEQAVQVANDSPYGLAGSVWTEDATRGMEIARRVRTGTFGINGYMMDFTAPFGGYKASGIGREFGPEGLDQYLELKSIVD